MSRLPVALSILARLAPSLATNAVIIAGFYRGGWSPGTVLALFWLETLLRIPLTALLLALHRGRTRKLGYYVLSKPARGGTATAAPNSLLPELLLASSVFAVVHGLFLGILLFWMLKGNGAIDLHDVRSGFLLLAVIMLVAFVADLSQLGSRSFAWARHRRDMLMQRVIILHLVIVFGMFAAALVFDETTAFFGVFIVFKLLVDPVSDLSSWDPEEAPRWLVWLGEKAAKGKGDIAAEWRRDRAARQDAERTLDEAGIAESA
jgi:hypothetical protein